MAVEKAPVAVPEQNFARGLHLIEIPELEEPIRGKVRDMWDAVDQRVIVTTDRQSAFDHLIATVPGKGQVLNLLSAYWFNQTKDIILNHLYEVIHPNVMAVEKAIVTLPVEVIVRDYMAKTSTPTSIYKNYRDGRREIYGIDFPNGLKANEKLPMGTILTPTTKEKEGHDQELTNKEAKEFIDQAFGEGTWDRISAAALEMFSRGRQTLHSAGFILADTKFEFGLNHAGNLMLIDELFTPDSSRIWLRDGYRERFEKEENPETFDKEILRAWLAEHGFEGKDGQRVPVVDPLLINELSQTYGALYMKVTNKDLPEKTLSQEPIKQAVLDYLS